MGFSLPPVAYVGTACQTDLGDHILGQGCKARPPAEAPSPPPRQGNECTLRLVAGSPGLGPPRSPPACGLDGALGLSPHTIPGPGRPHRGPCVWPPVTYYC